MKSNLNLQSKAYADSSLILLSEAIKADSSNKGAYWNKLAFETGMRRLQDAEQTAKLFFRTFRDPYALVSLGVINNQLGDSVEAKRNFRAALEYYQDEIRRNKIVEDSILFQLVSAHYLNNDNVKARNLYERYRKTREGAVTFEGIDFDSLILIFKSQQLNMQLRH